MNKLVWAVALTVLLSAGVVLAQTTTAETVSTTTSTTTTEVVIDDTLIGVTVDEITKMPTTWGLWWTSVKEKVSEVVTLDPVRKAEKQLQFAEQRMKYAEYIAENTTDPKKQAWAEKMVEKANKFMEKVEAKKENWAVKKRQD